MDEKGFERKDLLLTLASMGPNLLKNHFFKVLKLSFFP